METTTSGQRPLKIERERLKLTQKQAAAMFDVSLNAWQVWERNKPGEPKPPAYWLLLLHVMTCKSVARCRAFVAGKRKRCRA